MESFLLTCPLLAVAWKLFKGISPTIVALIAIYLNDKNARKRDIKNKVIDMKYTILSESLRSLYDLEKDVIYMMENIINLIQLRKNIMSLPEDDDGKECFLEMKNNVQETFEKLNLFLIQKNYLSNNKKMIEQVYNLNIFDDKFDESLSKFHHEVSRMLKKAISEELEFNVLEPYVSDIGEQINACKSIILDHIKKIVRG